MRNDHTGTAFSWPVYHASSAARRVANTNVSRSWVRPLEHVLFMQAEELMASAPDWQMARPPQRTTIATYDGGNQ